MSIKVGNAISFEKNRGISLLSVFNKWYVGCLVVLAKRQLDPRKDLRLRVCNVYGFEEEHFCEQITEGVRLILAKAFEWRGQERVFVFSGDVLAAFDNMTPGVICNTMQAWCIHPCVTAAMLSESK